MAKKRTDNKNQILHKYESQRPNGTYCYRHPKYKPIYAPTLKELREKEKILLRDINDGIDYYAGKTKMKQLVKQYVNQKMGVKFNTRKGYNYVLNLLEEYPIANKSINLIKTTDAKDWYTSLSKQGYSYNTISSIKSIVKPAFDMAVQDDAIRKNPFDFKLNGLIPNDTQKRTALTFDEQERLMQFMQEDKIANRYYNEVLILLQTGLRISELYGLTIKDIDFDKRVISVNKQIQRDIHCQYYIETPKTETGTRKVPMTNEVVQAFRDVLKKRKTKTEFLIDGYSGFIFLDKDNKPKVAGHLEHAMQRFMKRYNENHPDEPMEVVPHTLRHTFTTNMYKSNMPIKHTQYLLGHKDIATTLNVYTHTNLEDAARSFYDAMGQ